MMITLEAHYVYLLIISNAVMLALACLSFARFDRRCNQIEEFWASPNGSTLSDEDDAEKQRQLKMTQRLEKRVGELQRSVKVIELKKATPDERPVERNLPIENAVRMAKKGASVEDITRNCGLNIGEARLLQKLHGQTQLQSAASH